MKTMCERTQLCKRACITAMCMSTKRTQTASERGESRETERGRESKCRSRRRLFRCCWSGINAICRSCMQRTEIGLGSKTSAANETIQFAHVDFEVARRSEADGRFDHAAINISKTLKCLPCWSSEATLQLSETVVRRAESRTPSEVISAVQCGDIPSLVSLSCA